MRKELTGSLIGVLASAALGAAMLPVRSNLAVATAAVVLVVPVVAGVVSGGLRGRPSERGCRLPRL